jgi:hypothetical protein
MSLTTTTVTGNVSMVAGAGLPVDATAFFHPTSAITDIADKIYYLGQPAQVLVQSDGEFSAVLFNTDNPNIAPQGWEWVFWLRVGNQWGSFNFSLPATVYNVAPYNGTVDITVLMPEGWQL